MEPIIEQRESFKMQLPSTINNGTNVLVYCPGAGGLYDATFQKFTEDHPNDIIIMSNDSFVDSNAVISELNSIKSAHNITFGNIDVYSQSRGDTSVFKVAKALNDNDLSTTNIVILDTSHILLPQKKAGGYEGIVIDQNMANSFAENGTTVIIGSEFNLNALYKDNIQALIDAKVPIVHMRYGGGRDPSNGVDAWLHRLVQDDLLDCGIIDVLFGNKEHLDTIAMERYCSFYDYEKNEWIDGISEDEIFARLRSYRTLVFTKIDNNYGYLKELNEFDKNYLASLGYTDSLSSDDKLVMDYMNSIINVIKSTNNIGNLGNTMNGIGGNDVLDLESAIISKYFTSSNDLLGKIAKETDSIMNIAIKIDEMDAKISSYAKTLGKDEFNITANDINQLFISGQSKENDEPTRGEQNIPQSTTDKLSPVNAISGTNSPSSTKEHDTLQSTTSNQRPINIVSNSYTPSSKPNSMSTSTNIQSSTQEQSEQPNTIQLTNDNEKTIEVAKNNYVETTITENEIPTSNNSDEPISSNIQLENNNNKSVVNVSNTPISTNNTEESTPITQIDNNEKIINTQQENSNDIIAPQINDNKETNIELTNNENTNSIDNSINTNTTSNIQPKTDSINNTKNNKSTIGIVLTGTAVAGGIGAYAINKKKKNEKDDEDDSDI